jgi:hypothetical protein
MGSMNADDLELPQGVELAWCDSGMRIVMSYDANYDGFIVRFDTKSDGNQYNIAYRLTESADADTRARAEALIPTALQAWQDNAWARGRLIWFANDPRI